MSDTPGVSADAFVPLAATSRSGADESVHFGAAVAVDARGGLLFAAGDPAVAMYPRSSMKPLQAEAMMRAGFAGTDEQIALACASHDGTPAHLEVVRSILADAGLDEGALGNTPGWPLDRDVAAAQIAAGATRTPLFMNCSGKHAAMLSTCVANGWPIDTYLDADHPLQLAITDRVDDLAGGVRHIGVDGCGAPAHVMGLRGLAGAVAAVADERGAVWRAMNQHPVLVGGARRASARLVGQVPDLIAKEGAEGVFVAARPGGPSVAVKISDGAGRAAGVVAAAVLAATGVDADALAIGDPILGHGRPVGHVRPLIGAH